MELRVNDQISMALLRMGHAQELFELTDSNRTYLREWMPWLDDTTTVSDTAHFIQSTIEQNKKGFGPQFAVCQNGAICGVNGFYHMDTLHNVGAIGYWLAKSHTGKGIITMTTEALLRLGFSTYGLNKIEIHCAEGYAKSRSVPERLGFTYEATLRQCEWLYTKYVDHAVYSLLASEYKPSPKIQIEKNSKAHDLR